MIKICMEVHMKELKNDELISLYMAYESEWEYRDSSIWNIVTKMFVVTLTAILIPFLYKEYCGNYVPLIIFPVAGIIMASFTFFMLLGILTIIVLMLPKK